MQISFQFDDFFCNFFQTSAQEWQLSTLPWPDLRSKCSAWTKSSRSKDQILTRKDRICWNCKANSSLGWDIWRRIYCKSWTKSRGVSWMMTQSFPHWKRLRKKPRKFLKSLKKRIKSWKKLKWRANSTCLCPVRAQASTSPLTTFIKSTICINIHCNFSWTFSPICWRTIQPWTMSRIMRHDCKSSLNISLKLASIGKLFPEFREKFVKMCSLFTFML